MAEGVELPGVVAAIPEADEFAEAWERRLGMARRKRRAQRIYRLDRLRPVEGVTGRPRVATTEDRSCYRLDGAFAEEALGEKPSPASDTERVVDARLRGPGRGFLLWEDEDPVSMAGWGGATPSGIRIGPVYTPPDRRGAATGAP